MTRIPPAAIAVIAAAYDDYRLTTPPTEQTPHEAAERAAEYLASSGWGLTLTPPTNGAPCPACGLRYAVRRDGRIRLHRPGGHPCPGSHTPT
ncbi:hypothetical protein [Streptomyces thermolilacinus]|uniref:hypothetical protein n=1 Tax=Streptomyces thermolilacinus TaxID=285540 RepID=UPI0033DC8357